MVTLYGHTIGDLPIPKPKVGDKVRISKYNTVFTKVFRLDPVMYNIEDLDGETWTITQTLAI